MRLVNSPSWIRNNRIFERIEQHDIIHGRNRFQLNTSLAFDSLHAGIGLFLAEIVRIVRLTSRHFSYTLRVFIERSIEQVVDPMGNDATLRDVAEQAGVSLGTASLALNNRPSVAPETRARVLEAANRLGYAGRVLVRPTNNNRIKVLGMVIKHDLGLADLINPFYSYVQLGVDAEARKQGLGLMLANIEVDLANRPVMLPQLLDREQVDALLVVGVRLDESILRIIRERGLPTVLIDGHPDNVEFDTVQSDNFGGGYCATQHLIDHGHVSIGLIGSQRDSFLSVSERRRGYLAASAARGLTPFVEDSRLNRAAAYDATFRLLKRAPEVSAIVACNDECAFGVLDALRDMGHQCPDDVCVIGFDDLDLAREMRPALSTVRVHKAQLGVLGVRQLLSRAQDPEQPVLQLVVSTRIIERDTVCARSQQRGR
jgi:LacI family transcriptional regulator